MSDVIGPEAVIGDEFVIGVAPAAEAPPSSTNVPHLAVPFELGTTGAVVVEQDSPEDIAGQVQNVLAFAVGERIEQPEFGITPLQFQNAPLDLRTLMERVAKWVPNVTLQAIEEALSSEQERSTALEVTP